MSRDFFRLSLVFVFVSLLPVFGQETPTTPSLLPGLGERHHPISTTNPQAQAFFDQGLMLVFAFNREEAVRAFRRASELDPNAAMPYWGIALARGQHLNMHLDLDVDGKAAWEAIQRALSLRSEASSRERAYIEALAKRNAVDPKADPARLAREYRHAMARLVAEHPDDLDAAALYAESIMVLRPHGWWNHDGTPAEDTTEFLGVLKTILRRDPSHPAANHYYIHALDSSPSAEQALPSAERLGGLYPGAGHLVHMPAHIFWELGDYQRVAEANQRAVAADRAYFARSKPSDLYVVSYFAHNLHFIAVARAAQGRFADASRAAGDLQAVVAPHFDGMPGMIDYFMPLGLYVQMRFHRWDDILKTPAPDPRARVTTALWHFARASALAAKGDRAGALAEKQRFETASQAVPPRSFWVFNTAGDVLKVAAAELEARLAASSAESIALWEKSVEAEDALHHDEPPTWYYRVRESLGAALLRNGRAAEAEKVFRADLARHPRNPRSLFGLWQSLLAQNRTDDAQWVQREFTAAWQHADAPLTLDDLL